MKMIRILWERAFYSLQTAYYFLFSLDRYYQRRIFEENPGLEAQLSLPPDDIPPPNLQPLLFGTIQASDFVREYAESGTLKEEDQKDVDQESNEGGDSNEKRIFAKVPYEDFEKRQMAFEYAVLLQSVYLEVQLRKLLASHRWAAIVIFFSSILVIIGLLLLLDNDVFSYYLFVSSTIGYAAVILVVPTVSIALYGTSIHGTNQRKNEVQQRIIRLSSAAHVYETLDQIQSVGHRKERIKDRLQMEQEARIKLDYNQNREIIALEMSRASDYLHILRQFQEMGIEGDPLLFLSLVLEGGNRGAAREEVRKESTT